MMAIQNGDFVTIKSGHFQGEVGTVGQTYSEYCIVLVGTEMTKLRKDEIELMG
jgi:ribosomal protein L24